MAQDRKEYMKAWRDAHKDEIKDYYKAYNKSYYQSHKKENTARCRAYIESHKEEVKDYQREWHKAYNKVDVNSLGEPKINIRMKSQYYLKTHGTKIQGYQIHHCCTYSEPYKFIYCSKEMHLKIHNYLRKNHISSDTDHYEQIKHLLDDTVILYGLK